MGHKYVAPAISSAPLTDLDGNVISDGNGHVGFPGFDGMQATVTLGYIAALQEAGVPVTTGYISAAHEDAATGTPFGPGEAGYVAHLKAYDAAFAKFFARLAKDGITADNTLFVITADENDHFAGGPASPPGCDGVTTPCTYAKLGEVSVNLTGLLAQQGVTSPFRIATGLAVYANGNPAPDDAVTRTLERAVASADVTSPISGTTQKLAHYIADKAEMNLLHMTTADPARTPTFTIFPQPEDYLLTGPSNCGASGCVALNSSFNWLHGNVAPEINTTWLGIAGPGVKKGGVQTGIWSDHADIRPTMLALLGLMDDYSHQGRVLSELLDGRIEPASAEHGEARLERLGQVYKKLNAPVGAFGLASLKIATRAAAGGSVSNDAAYTATTQLLAALGQERDRIAGRMESVLDGAWFHDQTPDPNEVAVLTAEGELLVLVTESISVAP